MQKGAKLSPSPERSPAGPKGSELAGSSPGAPARKSGIGADAAAKLILACLDDDKAEEIVSIDIKGKSSVADRMIIASGRSQRHVAALAEAVIEKLKAAGAVQVRAEGLPHADWVLIDAGDVIVHLFRPEVRSFYNLEKIWSAGPASPSAV